jgi:hypothetical protein
LSVEINFDGFRKYMYICIIKLESVLYLMYTK